MERLTPEPFKNLNNDITTVSYHYINKGTMGKNYMKES